MRTTIPLPERTTIVRSGQKRKCMACNLWIAAKLPHLSERFGEKDAGESKRRTHLECLTMASHPLIVAALRDHDLETLRVALVKQNR